MDGKYSVHCQGDWKRHGKQTGDTLSNARSCNCNANLQYTVRTATRAMTTVNIPFFIKNGSQKVFLS